MSLIAIGPLQSEFVNLLIDATSKVINQWPNGLITLRGFRSSFRLHLNFNYLIDAQLSECRQIETNRVFLEYLLFIFFEKIINATIKFRESFPGYNNSIFYFLFVKIKK